MHHRFSFVKGVNDLVHPNTSPIHAPSTEAITSTSSLPISPLIIPLSSLQNTRPHPMITVFGSCSIDYFIRAPRLPNLGETVSGSKYLKAFGGKGANQAVQAALLGGKVSFVGRIGDTKEIRENFESYGVNVDHLNASDNSHSAGVAFIEVEEESGDNRIVVVPGANSLVSKSDLSRELLEHSAFLVMQLEIPFNVVMQSLKECPCKTVLNPSPVPSSDDDLKQLTLFLAFVDILVVNEHEAELLLSGEFQTVTSVESAIQCASALSRKCRGEAIVTMGGEGAVSQYGHVKSPRVRTVVDSTGAGDSFLGALVFSMSQGKPLQEAMEFACAIASKSVLKMGCQSSYVKGL